MPAVSTMLKERQAAVGLWGRQSLYSALTMTDLHFKDNCFRMLPNESVLDCLLRHGQAIPYACKAGMCQACLIKAVDCEATPHSRKWIKPALQAKGYTLACQWFPDDDVKGELPGVEDFSIAVTVCELTPLSPYVMRMRLTIDDPATLFNCRPGQYVSLINPHGITRSYSVANDLVEEGMLELHVSRTSHGVFTRWVFEEAAVGMHLHLRGPNGECHYDDREGNDYPMLLAGNGTGLAPLFGILRDALARGHEGPISLFHGGRTAAHIYLQGQLDALQKQYRNFSYFPCIVENNGKSGYQTGKLENVLDQQFRFSGAARTRAYLCGTPELVHRLRKHIYLKGIRSENIHCDPFTERTVVTTGAP